MNAENNVDVGTDTIFVSPEALRNIRFLQEDMDAVGWDYFGFSGGGCCLSHHCWRRSIEDLIFELTAPGVCKPEHMLKQDSHWLGKGNGSGFNLENPQAKRACGCGESGRSELSGF